jgi:hypothetical protein
MQANEARPPHIPVGLLVMQPSLNTIGQAFVQKLGHRVASRFREIATGRDFISVHSLFAYGLSFSPD